ncbi:hypothetical protein Hanom_Chr06g00547251 [Helianthus anomalus]
MLPMISRSSGGWLAFLLRDASSTPTWCRVRHWWAIIGDLGKPRVTLGVLRLSSRVLDGMAEEEKNKYSIIVPTYNERLNIALIVFLVFKHIPYSLSSFLSYAFTFFPFFNFRPVH